jgi:hypothetical protein
MATPEQQLGYMQAHIEQLERQMQQLSSSSGSSSSSRHIKPPKPSTFDGHVPSATNWVYEMQNYLVSAGDDLNSSTAVADAVPYLRDAAQTWYRQHQQAVEMCTATPYTSWTALKAAILHQFAPVDPQGHARDELMALSSEQHLDMAAYTERFTAIIVDLPNMNEGDRIYFFTRGLPSDVRMHVRMHNPSTLSHAMELAAQAGEATHGASGMSPPSVPGLVSPTASAPAPMELGVMRARYSSRNAPSGDLVCFFCEQPGHSFRHCRELALMKRELAAKRAAGGHAK